MAATSADAARALELADEAHARYDVEGVVAHLSAAVRGFTAGGEVCQAALASARLGDVYTNGLGNLVAGRAWYARAWRLIEHEPDCLEQGWVAVAAMGCDVDDPVALLAAAELALDRARRFGDVNLETKALADGGLAHVQAGRLDVGMAMLDEAMALACGPVDDLDVAAKSVCSFFTACYYATDFARAESWTDAFRRCGLTGPAAGAQAFLSSHCDSMQAALLVELGRWGDAERLLERAKAEFEAVMPSSSWHPDIGLADLRIRQGRLAEAEGLLLGKDHSMQALLPAARLHLARGDHVLARATIRRGLRAVGDDRLRGVELLTLLVDAELVAGDVDAAVTACAELTSRLAEVDVPALVARAGAARARVVLASGDTAGAVRLLESAVDVLDERQLPLLRALVLLDLARARHAGGDQAGAAIDGRAAAAVLRELDVVAPPDVAGLAGRISERRALVNGTVAAAQTASPTLLRDGRWWTASAGGTSVRVADTKGLRYLALLVAAPGVERHALDLVDAVEGVDPNGLLDRRRLGDAGPELDAAARTAYRRRIEALRSDADAALAADRLADAEAARAELDQLLHRLAAAYGLGGRDRAAASAAERARLNVTRAVRSALRKLVEALPEAGAALDRHVRTGLYCAYEPVQGELRWIVQPGVNGTRPA